ncbi:hypothetical protein IU459_35575 [Nocardia amamiensis]|uniref:Uncharacterized protein n=1 Tax=Nocardia amamiensis TaxID=404578 RepID=A0ABS0D1X9_9NOCA|nr:hypothetical protein [Nocardia amamiensis]MBF6302814.1 hypothetical protein [Nocardia amamiensis]
MSTYGLGQAFEDVSRAGLDSGRPLGSEQRRRAAHLLHTLIRAGHAAGLPDDPRRWASDPATLIVTAIRNAGPQQPVQHRAPAQCSAWALREAAAEMQLSEDINSAPRHARLTDDQPDTQGEFIADAIDELLGHADYIEENATLPTENQLPDYDRHLQALARP